MKKTYPVSIDMVIQWGEMDALGHVNNARYFEYFEAARIFYFHQLGQKELQRGHGEGPVLAHIGCQFKLPIVYPDTITIGVWVERIGNTSMKMDYEIYSSVQKKVVATAESIVVMIDYTTNEKVSITEEMRNKIYDLQAELNK